jgi:hypothetical protein
MLDVALLRRSESGRWGDGERAGACRFPVLSRGTGGGRAADAAGCAGARAQGRSGNPAGRPRGSRNQATRMAEMLLDAAAANLAGRAIERALDGDDVALRFCLARIVAPAGCRRSSSSCRRSTRNWTSPSRSPRRRRRAPSRRPRRWTSPAWSRPRCAPFKPATPSSRRIIFGAAKGARPHPAAFFHKRRGRDPVIARSAATKQSRHPLPERNEVASLRSQ